MANSTNEDGSSIRVGNSKQPMPGIRPNKRKKRVKRVIEMPLQLKKKKKGGNGAVGKRKSAGRTPKLYGEILAAGRGRQTQLAGRKRGKASRGRSKLPGKGYSRERGSIL